MNHSKKILLQLLQKPISRHMLPASRTRENIRYEVVQCQKKTARSSIRRSEHVAIRVLATGTLVLKRAESAVSLVAKMHDTSIYVLLSSASGFTAMR